MTFLGQASRSYPTTQKIFFSGQTYFPLALPGSYFTHRMPLGKECEVTFGARGWVVKK